MAPCCSREIDERDYPGDAGNVTMMAATADHIAAASRDVGLDPALPDAVKSLYDRAIAAGRGKDGWPVPTEVVHLRIG